MTLCERPGCRGALWFDAADRVWSCMLCGRSVPVPGVVTEPLVWERELAGRPHVDVGLRERSHRYYIARRDKQRAAASRQTS
jgi:hypothetical protein